MNEKEINATYARICSSFAARRLKPAFDQLGKLITKNGLGVYHDEYMNLEETYQYMLKYTVEGISDPERQKVYRKLIVSSFQLTDTVYEALQMKLSPSVEYDKKRMLRGTPIPSLSDYLAEMEDFYLHEGNSYTDGRSSAGDKYTTSEDKMRSSVDAEKEVQRKIVRLFYHIWFSDKLSTEESRQWRKILFSHVLPVSYKAFLVTAVTLSLQRFYETEKFMLLFESYDSEEVRINQRALAGLLINLYKYDSRMPFFPEINGRLKILNENPEFKRNLERIIIQLIRSKETEKLQQRIRDEILPEMIRISPNLKNKINLDSLMEEGLQEDKNPDWQDIFKDSPGLLNKMEEFSEMQMKGADVFMGSFSMLKSFPFFNEMSNWFMPFFPENPDIAEMLDVQDDTIGHLVDAIERAPILCNSDKYSFCLSIQRLPKENLSFMTQAMQAEMEQLKELKEDEELLDPGRNAEFVSNQYIQDLYRFYKLFPRKGDFEDIFNWRFDFHNKFALGGILKEDLKVLRNIAEYYFARDQYDEAVEVFDYLLGKEKSGEIYQKIAWCHQKRGDFRLALDSYLKAELYEVNQLWNQKKIALCYRNLKKPAKALKYYQEVEKNDPDDLGNHLNIGHCLLELEKFDEALKCYFKVEYLAPGNKKVWRPIGWCSFLTGKKEQSEKYFHKLIEDEPGKHDLINMGHVQWSLGNRKEALDYYRKSITHKISAAGSTQKGGYDKDSQKQMDSTEKFSEEEFLGIFEEDLPHLLNQGVDKDDVPIMLDQLRYLLQG